MSTIKLITLNIEGDKHLDLIKPFLIKENPDVICLQELFETDFNYLKQYLKMDGLFAPLVNINAPNKIGLSPRGNFGVAILSQHQISTPYQGYYEKHQTAVPYFDDRDPNCLDRILLAVKVTKDDINYQIATTHFTYSEKGKATKFQHQSLNRLFRILDRVGECVLTGDFNAPRGNEIHTRLIKRFTDNTPPRTITTLDKNIHRIKTIPDFVVDYIFTSKDYLAKNVKVVNHVSDHMAVVANINRI